MRVTNNLIYGQSSRAIGQANEKMMKVQEKIAAQTDIVKPSDNPVGASQLLMYEGSNNRLKLFDESIKMATSSLEYQEVALDSLNDSLDDARTLFIQAQNHINTQDDIDAIIQEVTLITESMAELMNSKSADGNYIFAGTDTQGPPFLLDGQGRYQWAGNESVRYAQISEDMKIPITDSGKKLFQDIWTNRTFSSQVIAGDVSLKASVKNQGDFDQFMDRHYDPQDPLRNVYVITTLPTGAENGTLPSVDLSLIGSESEVDAKRRESFDGTPGVFSVTNSAGDVVSSGSYTTGKPINFNGMSLLLRGAPGASVGVSLDKPKRDNVLNEINDSLVTLGNKNATEEERSAAFFSATESINNAQTKVGEGRSSVGARLNTLRDREDFSSANQLSNTIAQDRVGGLDLAAAATELSMNESALNASQQVFTRISNLSLFNKM
ncbi:flagellar hook-associated protein FlgL [Marinomonas sp. IMCC 4694]|uniref:flagellar hook-associated protein FlgL n=1 Tax=Marinomonas sp. IMCC 4694 TaxID=2605432 RepID=UPI0011E71E75|nr:flagellar hook-associated protein FlgL [Marinomonas sp. IMCC 4694]TYL47144.1 flagellar hook-associated protein 3 [Marinomonas sp. IMCC 4694]